jgi:hypothetical protein
MQGSLGIKADALSFLLIQKSFGMSKTVTCEEISEIIVSLFGEVG